MVLFNNEPHVFQIYSMVKDWRKTASKYFFPFFMIKMAGLAACYCSLSLSNRQETHRNPRLGKFRRILRSKKKISMNLDKLFPLKTDCDIHWPRRERKKERKTEDIHFSLLLLVHICQQETNIIYNNLINYYY